MQLTTFQQRALAWSAIAAVAVLLLWLFGPVLTPFLVGMVLAYALNPVVNWADGLFRGHMPRVVGVVLVELAFVLIVTGIVLLAVPVVTKQLPLIRDQLPRMFDQLSQWLQPLLSQLGVQIDLDIASLRDRVIKYLSEHASSFGESLLSSLKLGGSVAFAIVGNVVLIPVVLFYLLLDWPRFMAFLYSFVPPRFREAVDSFTSEADGVLGQYLRGQLLVMLVLAVYYSVGLAAFGLNLALPIGVFTGLAICVPYLGFGVGLVLALLAGMLQFSVGKALLMLGVVYGAGQVLESFYLTPRLVGERIGLHPLVVIFILLAFGQLFGFVGVLVALPVGAVMLVALRRVRAGYLASPIYKG